ncbi:hypothetical protein QOT17_011928 [Balamuthia mandrillaris]
MGNIFGAPALRSKPWRRSSYFTLVDFHMRWSDCGSILFMNGQEELFDLGCVYCDAANQVEELFHLSDTDQGYAIQVWAGKEPEDPYVYIEHGPEVCTFDAWYRVPISIFRHAFANLGTPPSS